MRAEKLKTQLIDEVVRFVGERIERKRAPQVDAFIRAFYANVPQADIAGESPEDLFSAAVSLANFAQTRLPTQAKVRVFNPHIDEHGWRSPHTVIEIVNDDMPFLVDSVSQRVRDSGAGIDWSVHPILRLERDAAGRTSATQPAKVMATNTMAVRFDKLFLNFNS